MIVILTKFTIYNIYFDIQQNNCHFIIKMNLQKLVSQCLTKRRSQSQRNSQCSNKTQIINNSHTKNHQNLFHTNKTTSELVGSQMHSFQPQIHQLPKNLYKASVKTECSKQQIAQRLLNDRRDRQSLWARQKAERQEQQYEKVCTFRPKINENSKRILKTECTEHYHSVNDNDPFERLYNQGINKIKQSETLNISQNKQNYSFQPQTNYRNVLNSECKMKPIYERIQQIMKQKRNYLSNLQQKNEQKQVRQRPKISRNTQKIIGNKEQFKKNIMQRISGYIIHERNKIKQNQAKKQQNMQQNCTFQPQIGATTTIFQNFEERQQQYVAKLNQKLTSRIHQQQNKNFKPNINRISQMLVAQDRANQNFEDKIQRIASQHPSKQEKQFQIQKQIYKECTFEPQINLLSKQLGNQSRKMSHNCAKHICQNMNQKQEHFEFKPKINKISEVLVKMRRENGQPSMTKRTNIDHLKMQAEYKQMKQCTFQPKINSKNRRNRPKTQYSINQVAGFDAYYEKVNKIMYKKEQQKKRQQQLFKLEKRYSYRKSTQPKQFRLSQGFDHKQQIKQEINKKFQQICTFKPQINNIR